MAKRRDHITAWFKQLRNEDQINQALLDLTRNESRMQYTYKRPVHIMPPLVSISNNVYSVALLNNLIKESLHTIVDEEHYITHLKRNVPHSDVKQVILNNHVRKEKKKLFHWIRLLNLLVVHTAPVKTNRQPAQAS